MDHRRDLVSYADLSAILATSGTPDFHAPDGDRRLPYIDRRLPYINLETACNFPRAFRLVYDAMLAIPRRGGRDRDLSAI